MDFSAQTSANAPQSPSLNQAKSNETVKSARSSFASASTCAHSQPLKPDPDALYPEKSTQDVLQSQTLSVKEEQIPEYGISSVVFV